MKGWFMSVYTHPASWDLLLRLLNSQESGNKVYYDMMLHIISREWASADEAWDAWNTKLRRYLDGDS